MNVSRPPRIRASLSLHPCHMLVRRVAAGNQRMYGTAFHSRQCPPVGFPDRVSLAKPHNLLSARVRIDGERDALPYNAPFSTSFPKSRA